LIEFKSL